MKWLICIAVFATLCAPNAWPADAVILSWNPPESDHLGRTYRAGELIRVPQGQVADVIFGGGSRISLTGEATFRVPKSERADLVDALHTALQRFGRMFQLRSASDASPPPVDPWVLDAQRAGPHCTGDAQPLRIWAVAGESNRDFEVTLADTSVIVRVPRAGNSVTWPASLQIDPDRSYVVRDLHNNASVARTFKRLDQVPSDTIDLTIQFLKHDCIAQAASLLDQLPRAPVGSGADGKP